MTVARVINTVAPYVTLVLAAVMLILIRRKPKPSDHVCSCGKKVRHR